MNGTDEVTGRDRTWNVSNCIKQAQRTVRALFEHLPLTSKAGS